MIWGAILGGLAGTIVLTTILRAASELGVMQLHLTGGEPLAREDLTELVSAGRKAGLYINLLTSGIGLAPDRLEALVHAGLDSLTRWLEKSGI